MQRSEQIERVLLLGMFSMEFLLFCSYSTREILPFFPRGWDQMGYYINSFAIFDSILKREWSGLPHLFMSQGILLPLTTAFSYLILGISRINGLILILLIWLLSQYLLLRHYSQRVNRSFGTLMLGLFLTCESYLQVIGGVVDFRFDAPGGILYGISLLFLIESERLTKQTETNLLIMASLVTILVRPNLLLLLVPALLCYSLFLLVRRQFHPTRWAKALWGTTWLCIGLAIVTLSFIARSFYRYYLASYISWDSRTAAMVKTMREAMEIPDANTWTFRLYPLINLFHDHLGSFFVLSLLGCLLVLGICRVIARNSPKLSGKPSGTPSRDLTNTLIASSLFLSVPLFLYIMSVSRNPVLATNCVVPMLVLIGVPLTGLHDNLTKYTNAVQTALIPKLGLTVLALGFIHVIAFFASTRDLPTTYRTAETMAREINQLVQRLGISNPRVTWLDFNEMSNNMLVFYGYLQENRLIQYNTDIRYEPPTDAEMTQKVDSSEIVIDNVAPGSLFAPVSFNKKIALYREAAAPVLARKFKKLEREYETPWGRYQVFVEKQLNQALTSVQKVELDNPYGDWLAKKVGLTIQRVYVNTLSKIVLTGRSQTYVDQEKLRFRLQYFDVEGKELALQNAVKPSYDSNWYRIEIPIPANLNVAKIVLLASIGFVPRELGMNDDVRELVLRYPQFIVAE